MNFERAYRRLIDKNLETDRVYISFRDKEKRWFGFEKKFLRHTQSKEHIIAEIRRLFFSTHNPNILYRSTGITFINLEPATPKQYTLDEQPLIGKIEATAKLEKAINELNKKYGRMTVTRAGSGKIDPRYMSTHQKKKLKKTTQSRIRGMRDMRLL